MPALSPTMTHGKLARWRKAEGDPVAEGDVLAEVETDKATVEVEALEEGVLGSLVVPEGAEDIPVNEVIAVVLTPGEGADAHPDLGAEVESAKPVATRPDADAAVPESTGGSMTTQTVREALRDAMAEEMRRDPDVFLMGEEVAQYEGAYKVSQGLLAEFGDRRVVDTPITEYGFAHLGVGAALAGLKPIVEFMTFNFAMQAIDAIVNSAAKTLYMSGGQMSVPIVFRGPNGPAARVAAQHSQDFASWYAHVPGLIVIAPFSAADTKGLLKAAIRSPNPVVFLEHELLYGMSFEVPTGSAVQPIGKAKIVRSGADVTLVAYSRGVAHALEAAERLAGEGIAAEVIDLRVLRPMDTDAIVESVKKTNRIVAVEEGWPLAGIGAEIVAVVSGLAFDDLDAPPARVSAVDVPLPYAANLEARALPTAERIAAAAKAACYR